MYRHFRRLSVLLVFCGAAAAGAGTIAPVHNRLTNSVRSYPVVSVREIQEVPRDSLLLADELQNREPGRASLQWSPFVRGDGSVRDTVTVIAVCVVPPRVLMFTVGGYTMLLADPSGGSPWAGIFVRGTADSVQHDLDGFSSVQAGQLIRLTGVVTEFPTATMNGETILQAVPGDSVFVLGESPLPPPVPALVSDFYTGPYPGGSVRYTTGEQWEGTVVELHDLTVASVVNPASGTFSVVDGSGNSLTTYDASTWFTLRPFRDPASEYTVPPVGSHISSLRGFIHVVSGAENPRGYRIAPVFPGDISTSPPSGISGTAFEDADGNGTRGRGERGLEGWTITLINRVASDPVSISTSTDPAGNFSFTGIASGLYVLGEALQEGWEQTLPSGNGTYSISFSGGASVAGMDFGNRQVFPPTGFRIPLHISDNGSNATTIRFGSSPGATRCRDDSLGEAELPPIPPSGVFDARFLDPNGEDVSCLGIGLDLDLRPPLAPGRSDTFLVRFQAGGGYPVLLSWPPLWRTYRGPVRMTDGAGAGVIDLDMKAETTCSVLRQAINSVLIIASEPGRPGGSISGRVFNDLNGDGAEDPAEPGMEGWSIGLYLSSATGPVAVATTGMRGGYSFDGLQRVNYIVREFPSEGWQETYPSGDGLYVVDLTIDSVKGGVDFGNHRTAPPAAIVEGTVFNDINANSIRERGEPGLAGWLVTLTGAPDSAQLVLTKTTDVDGRFRFSNVPPGSYVLQETPQPRWLQTTPPGPMRVIVREDEPVIGLLFGNRFQPGPVVPIHVISANGASARLAFGADPLASRCRDERLGEYELYPPPPSDVFDARLIDPLGFNEACLGQGTALDLRGLFSSAQTDTYMIAVQPGRDGLPYSVSWPRLGALYSGDVLLADAATGGTLVSADMKSDSSVSIAQAGVVTLRIIATGPVLSGTSLSGRVFNDLDGSGIADSTEPGLPGWPVVLSLDVASPPAPIMFLTERDGRYQAAGLPPGPYRIRSEGREGFTLTAPPGDGEYRVDLDSGAFVGGLDFGFHRNPPASVSGTVFNDADSNGVRDPGEQGLEAWDINLSMSRGSVAVVILARTDSAGAYTFDDVPPGTYTLFETPWIGWSQTYPADDRTITVSPGSQITGMEFGNHFISLPRRPPGAGALLFHGESDYVEMADDSILGRIGSRFTLEFWIRIEELPAVSQQVIGKWDCGSDASEFAVDIFPDGSLWVSLSGTLEAYSLRSSPLQLRRWTHVASVLDAGAGSHTLYLNGNRDRSQSVASGFAINRRGNLPFRIGAHSLCGTPTFSGMLAEVRIWNVSRTPEQVFRCADSSLGGAYDGLVGYWKLNEGGGMVVNDASGHGSTGTLVNGPEWVKFQVLSAPEDEPVSFGLSQNYPNPFNPVTTITYSLDERSPVSLRLYDLLGREVRTVVDEVQGPGDMSAVVDGEGLASGVYYYVLRAGPRLEVKRMTLMR